MAPQFRLKMGDAHSRLWLRGPRVILTKPRKQQGSPSCAAGLEYLWRAFRHYHEPIFDAVTASAGVEAFERLVQRFKAEAE